MKIKVLKNFGLNGENLEAGTIVTVNRSHFGDNIDAFRSEGYFEEVTEETREQPKKSKRPTPAKKQTTSTTKKPAASKKPQGTPQATPVAPEPAPAEAVQAVTEKASETEAPVADVPA